MNRLAALIAAAVAVMTLSLLKSRSALTKISSSLDMATTSAFPTVAVAAATVGNETGAEEAAGWISGARGDDEARPAAPQIPPSNASLPTVALIEPHLKGGFRNQAMRLTAFVMHAVANDIPQILLESIRFGDKFGTEKPIPFEELFDVDEWNKYAVGGTEVGAEGARLPRMVPYDPSQHYHWNESYLTDRTARDNPTPKKGTDSQFKVTDEGLRIPAQNATHPYAFGGGVMAGILWREYVQYSSRRSRYSKSHRRHPVEALIFRALQPSAKLRSVMDAKLPASVRRQDYICIHPRVEFDMQTHARCSGSKRTGYERTLDTMLKHVESAIPTAPASEVFLPINQATMDPTITDNAEWKQVLTANLRTLNETLTHGLWNGTVRAFESGESLVRDDPRFAGMRSTTGSVINFFLAVEARLFVGQGASTWSVDAAAVRYHRLGGNATNYMFWEGGFLKLEGDPRPHSCD